MRVEMIKRVQTTETVEIELPYYYENAVGEYGDYQVYGKIEEDRLVTITVRQYENKSAFDLEIDKRHVSTCGEFMESYYKSTEAEFLQAKADMLAALTTI